MKHPKPGRHCCSIILFGATGDLTKKKLIPAIYNLVKNKRLDDFVVVGIARQQLTTKKFIALFKKYVKITDKKAWKRLEKNLQYYPLDFYDEKKYADLQNYLNDIDNKYNPCGNRLFYLATLPQHFSVITKNLAKHKIARQARNWTRVVFEKPFGHDLASAKQINQDINKVFTEEQIYRIDHYLGKELVQNIAVMRFTNTILEPLWNENHIDHVQIILSEDFGIAGRGPYYDKYGAIKDVVQNHMLQMLCLTAMEAPVRFTAEYIRNEKVKVLQAIRTPLIKDVVLGQYAGYRKEKGVKKNSTTETFAAIKLFIDNHRWKGIPFYLITGKHMKKRQALIYIQFEDAPCELFEEKCTLQPNHLVIMVQPDEGFYLTLNAKVPGKMDIVPVKMDFCHACIFGPDTPEAYENLLLDVMKGDQSVFIRTDEIELSWKITDTITKKRLKVYPYRKGSYPQQADRLIQKENRYWHL